MSCNPHAKAAKAYLEELCRMIDRGQRPVRSKRKWWEQPMAKPAAAVGLALGAASCGGSTEFQEPVPQKEVCNDSVDNDADGLIDCADPDCQCSSPVYSAPTDGGPGTDAGADARDARPPPADVQPPPADVRPPPEDAIVSPDVAPKREAACHDNQDNDGDGLVDCMDPDCYEEYCCSYMNTDYAAPPAREQLCSDGRGDDCDGLTDCADPDCAVDSCCVTAGKYGVPMELCSDGKDNDCDGLVDCLDPNCAADLCCSGAEYAAPPPEQTQQACGDGQDNDCDGLADCEDPGCIEFCAVPAYAAPPK
jgi:hypothetical protein